MADTNEAQLLSDLLGGIAREGAQLDAAHLEARVMAGPRPALTPQTITDPDRLAAELGEIRERDTSISIEETITGIVGFGAPVRDATGRLLAAVHISAFKDNLAEDDVPRIEQATREAALDIQRALSASALHEVLA